MTCAFVCKVLCPPMKNAKCKALQSGSSWCAFRNTYQIVVVFCEPRVYWREIGRRGVGGAVSSENGFKLRARLYTKPTQSLKYFFFLVPIIIIVIIINVERHITTTTSENSNKSTKLCTKKSLRRMQKSKRAEKRKRATTAL